MMRAIAPGSCGGPQGCFPHLVGRNMRRFLLVLLLLLATAAGCKDEIDNSLAPPPEDLILQPQKPVAPKVQAEKPAPSLKLRVYPDMAVPGRQVVLTAEVGSVLSTDGVDLTFEATNDPCGGTITQDGYKLTYDVPKDCRGSKIELTAIVRGEFGEVRKAVALEIKGATSSDSVVLRSPLPWEKVISPVLARWDRTLYQNRGEKLKFHATLQAERLFDTGLIEPTTLVELDLPPSPESVVVKAQTSGGSEEILTLKVLERKAPFFPPWGKVIHDCKGNLGQVPDRMKVLSAGGETEVGVGLRYSPSGQDTFTFVNYHVGKKQRFDRKESAMGIEVMVDGEASSAVYDFLHVWIKGDKTGGFTSPIYVTIKGNMGGERRFKIVRARETWFDFRFPIKAALKEGKGESVKSVMIFADARDVNPPLALFMVGGIYLEPSGAPSQNAVQELPPSGVEPEPGAAPAQGAPEEGATPSSGAEPGAEAAPKAGGAPKAATPPKAATTPKAGKAPSPDADLDP